MWQIEDEEGQFNIDVKSNSYSKSYPKRKHKKEIQ